MKGTLLCGGLLALVISTNGNSADLQFSQTFSLQKFYKGNTHTHSNRSDGDSTPEKVIQFYTDPQRGYSFLVLTDHDRASQDGEFSKWETPGQFIMIPGEEVTSSSHTSKGEYRPIHVNSLCSQWTVGGKFLKPPSAALQDTVDRIIAQPGAVAQVNHPNFLWSLTPQDLSLSHGARLLEIANQHPYVQNEGDSQHLSTEALWDHLLSTGHVFWGMATDDAHHFNTARKGASAKPGQGWVQVAAADLTPGAICDTLSSGRFYASTGVELGALQVQPEEIILQVKGTGPFSTKFIGKNSETLATVSGNEPHYVLRGNESYVRAVVTGPRGKKAWIQPQFTEPKGETP